MTEPEQAESPEQESGLTPADTPDVVLQLLVKASHEGVTEMGLTLNVNGSLISGILIGRDRWFRELADWADSQVKDGGAIPRVIGDLLVSTDEEAGSPDIPADSFAYVHLKNARFFGGPSPMPRVDGFFWRGRLSHVSGWAMGSLSLSD